MKIKRRMFGLIFCVVASIFSMSCSQEAGNSCGCDQTAISSDLFYFGGLNFVDPSDPVSLFVIDPGTIDHHLATGIFCGIPNYMTHSISAYNLSTVVYVRDGKFWRVSTLKGAPKTPVQVSSESNAGNIEILKTISDYADHEQSIIVYAVPGPDGIINTLDDEYKMIRLNMSATDPPQFLDIGNFSSTAGFNLPLIWPLYGKDGSIGGFLSIYGRTLARYDADFNHVIDIAPANSSIAIGIYDNAIYQGSLIPVVIDGLLRFVNVTDNSITKPIYLFSTINWYGIEEQDGSFYYYVDGAKILKVPGDGVNPPTILVDEGSGNNIWRLSFTANKVTYMLNYGAIKSVPKNGGSPIVAASPPTGQNILLTYVDWTTGQLYYGTYMPSASDPFNEPVSAGMVKDDGTTGLSPVSPAGWIGEGFNSTIPYSTDHTSSKYIFLVRDYPNSSATGFAGGTMESYDVSTAAKVASLGKVPSDIISMVPSLFGVNDGFLAAGKNAGGYGDIFFINPASNGSLVRLTNTPTIDESIKYIPSSSLMGFSGFVDSSP